MLTLSRLLEPESLLGLLRTTPAGVAGVDGVGGQCGESADFARVRPELSILAAEGSCSSEMARLFCNAAPVHVLLVLRRRPCLRVDDWVGHFTAVGLLVSQSSPCSRR